VAPRTANTNPVFESLELGRQDSADAEFAPLVQPVLLDPEEIVRIRPVFTAGSIESYERLLTDVNTREVFVERTDEDLAVQWFATAGELQDEVTAKKLTRTLDTAFTAPTSGRVSMWLVVRDGRGGSAWTFVELEVR
jgi:hypothetical protein